MKTNPDDSVSPFKVRAVASGYGGQDFEIEDAGLSKREHFAALAMQGLLASNWGKRQSKDGADLMLDQVVEASVLASDALIAELNKEGEG